MRFRFQKPSLVTAILAMATAGSALASPALGDDPAAAPPTSGDPATPSPSASADASPTSGEKKVEYGVGIRLRNVRAPKGMLQLFVESAPGGVSNVGFGVDLVRRRGNLELQLGFEFEHIQPTEGVWIESNSNVAVGDEADFIVGPDRNGGKSLGWFTIEFTFLNHTPITKNVAIRYGGGAGIGVVTGELGRFNVACVGATNETPEPGCRPAELMDGGLGLPSPQGGDQGGPGIKQYNLPPVFPVVNAIIGVQIRPIPKVTINVEGGIRTFPFFGISGGYFF
jgi:hypothetical protein